MEWNLSTYEGQAIDDYIWFSNNTFNGLFRTDIKTGITEWIDRFPDEAADKWSMHKKCFRYYDKLVFLPAYGNHIHIYDTKSNTFQSIQYDDESEATIDRISDACMYGDSIYIFPVNIEGDLKRFDLKTEIIEVIPEFKEQIRECNIEKKEIHFLLTRVELDPAGCILFALWSTDILAKWFIGSKKLQIEHSEINDIFSMNLIDSKKWIIKNNSSTLYCSDENGTVTEFRISNNDRTEYRRYNRVLKFGSDIIVLPAYDDCLYVVKGDTLVDIAKIEPVNKEVKYPHSFNVCKISEELWVLPFATKGCLTLGKDLTIKNKIPFKLDNTVIQNSILKDRLICQSQEGLISENEAFGIGDFIKAING